MDLAAKPSIGDNSDGADAADTRDQRRVTPIVSG
jgi:hypothetical protein